MTHLLARLCSFANLGVTQTQIMTSSSPQEYPVISEWSSLLHSLQTFNSRYLDGPRPSKFEWLEFVKTVVSPSLNKILKMLLFENNGVLFENTEELGLGEILPVYWEFTSVWFKIVKEMFTLSVRGFWRGEEVSAV
ncbi:uncharacterized protein JCM6883_002376 [Sporobolomyces salmoneus]|uniref:uncharacterized protein n=1 Tax=Sporobolomyces salmoneus TaxID=183962 RepID=UPI00317EB9A5